MQNYQDLLRRIQRDGVWQTNRTGLRSRFVSGATLRYDLREGAPAITTRKLAFKSFMGELVGFLRGVESAADMRSLGCGFWDANSNRSEAWLANANRRGDDDLGCVYGSMWRRWPAYRRTEPDSRAEVAAIVEGWTRIAIANDGQAVLFREIDQLGDCVRKLLTDPTDRRILFTGFNPAELGRMALPPCHSVPVQFVAEVESRSLDVCMYQRSADVPLGVVGNLISTAALLTLIARLTGFTPRYLSWFGGDCHYYDNQVEMVETVLSREPYESPRLMLSSRVPDCSAVGPEAAVRWLDGVEPGDFWLDGYQHHPAVTAEMAV